MHADTVQLMRALAKMHADAFFAAYCDARYMNQTCSNWLALCLNINAMQQVTYDQDDLPSKIIDL